MKRSREENNFKYSMLGTKEFTVEKAKNMVKFFNLIVTPKGFLIKYSSKMMKQKYNCLSFLNMK